VLKKLLVLCLFALPILFFAPASVHAGDQDFTLINNTGVEINNLYVAESKSDDWGDDVLGKDTLGDGENTDISFDRDETECMWDFQVRDKEGNGVEWREIDLCKYQKITLHMKADKVWATFE
jgi:hypothetical protein